MMTSTSPQTIVPLQRELPAVTDWEDFSAWCRKNGRPALPASRETLTLYFSDKRNRKEVVPNDRLGILALIAAIAGMLLPVVSGSTLYFKNGNLEFSLVLGLLIFIVSQTITLGTGWVSRETPAGKAGLLIAVIGLVTCVGIGWLSWKAGLLPMLVM